MPTVQRPSSRESAKVKSVKFQVPSSSSSRWPSSTKGVFRTGTGSAPMRMENASTLLVRTWIAPCCRSTVSLASLSQERYEW